MTVSVIIKRLNCHVINLILNAAAVKMSSKPLSSLSCQMEFASSYDGKLIEGFVTREGMKEAYRNCFYALAVKIVGISEVLKR